MMCFHRHDSRCDLVLQFIIFVIYSNLLFCSNAAQSSRERSSIILYQGTDKYHLDAKDCPVGMALARPERFSCACINGIWAFYENPCSEPVAIVGGNNHCFQMPSQPIRLVVAVSNPLRAMGELLTVFEGNMEGIRSKIYRSIHMRLTDADKFVTLNSSWTLSSPDGSKSICLESKSVIFDGLTSEEAAKFPDASYCSYTDLSAEMPVVGTIRKGCNSSMVMEPTQCQPMLPNIGDEVCMGEQILKDYQEASLQEVNLEPENDLEESLPSVIRPSRSLKNLGRFMERQVSTEPVKELPAEMIDEVVHAYKGEPEWHRRLAANDDSNQNESTPSPQKHNRTQLNAIDLNEAWENPQHFLKAPHSNSSVLVTNHLWMYRRVEIRNALNITRLVPPEDDLAVQIETGKVKKLFGIHRDIMKKICPLAPPTFFDTVAGTFVGVLTKGFRWKEPFLEQTHYIRILTSLSLCKNNALMMKFAQPETCSYKETGHIALPSTEGNETVHVQLDIPEVFRTKNFEPVIEAVWKIFLTVHSYCFKDFSDQYQDHHKYTMLMMGLFSSQIHDVWVRNQTLQLEYGGILGNLVETMQGLEKCAAGARLTSEYPFHMNRPTKLTKYQDDDENVSAIGQEGRTKRSKRDAPEVSEWSFQNYLTDSRKVVEKSSHPRMRILSRKKRLTVNSVNAENRIGDTIFNGRGICLKKYGDQRAVIGNHCKKRSRK